MNGRVTKEVGKYDAKDAEKIEEKREREADLTRHAYTRT